MIRIFIMFALGLLTMLASCAGLVGCSAPTVEVVSAGGQGHLELAIDSERLRVEIGAQTAGDAICPSWAVDGLGLHASGLMPAADPSCAGTVEESRPGAADLILPIGRIVRLILDAI